MAMRPPGSSLTPPQESRTPGGPILVRLALPYPELSPNFRPRFKAEKFQAVAAYRQDAEVRARNVRIARQLRSPLEAPVGVRIVYVVPRGGRRDPDNLQAQLKPGFDGMVRARLLSDDCVGKISIREVDLVVVKGIAEGFVAIELEPGYHPLEDPSSLAYRIQQEARTDGK